jgi:tetratricopeptide (TPR) repeat protein
MRAVLDRHPDYVWGWDRLIEWYGLLGDEAARGEAAERLVAVDPGSAHAQRCLAIARRRRGDVAGAREAWRRVRELAPENLNAAANLFLLDIEVGDLTAAEETLQAMRPHAPPALALGFQIELDALRERRADALEGMGRLVADPDAKALSLRRAVEAIIDAGWQRDLLDVFETAASGEVALPASLAPYWLQSVVQEHGWGAGHALIRRLSARGAVAREAAVTYMYLLGSAGTQETDALLESFLSEEAAWLADDVETWGRTAWAFLTIGRTRGCLEWTADWRDRAGVQPWMLANRLHALLELGRADEARELSRAALAIEDIPADEEGIPLHLAWLAFDAALRGDVAAAREALEAIPTPIDNADAVFQVGMTEALIDLARIEAGALSKSGLAAARRRLEAAAEAHPTLATGRTEAWLRRLHRQCLRRLGEPRGGRLAWLRLGR